MHPMMAVFSYFTECSPKCGSHVNSLIVSHLVKVIKKHSEIRE